MSNAPSTAPDLRTRFRAFVTARLDPKTYVGLHLTVGLVIGAVGLWLFSALLDAVLDNATLVRWDIQIDLWIHQHVTSTGLVIFDWITRIGSPLSMVILAAVVAAVLWRQHRYTAMLAVIAALAGEGALEYTLKLVVRRNRPTYGAAYLSGHSYSFPSGHSMTSFVAVGILLYVLGLYWHPSRLIRRAVRFLGAVVVLLVGISRIYLGVHYPSDVLGGYTAGAAWLAVCISGLAIALHRQPPLAEVRGSSAAVGGASSD